MSTNFRINFDSYWAYLDLMNDAVVYLNYSAKDGAGKSIIMDTIFQGESLVLFRLK